MIKPIPYKGYEIQIHNKVNQHEQRWKNLYECHKLNLASWSLASLKEAIRKSGFKTYELSELLTNSK